MPKEQLVNYVRAALAQGTSRDDIIRSLLVVGWQMGDINAALSVDKGSTEPVLEPLPPQNTPSMADSNISATSGKSFFSGRINRRTYLGSFLITILFLIVIVIVLAILTSHLSYLAGVNSPASLLLLVFILYVLLLPLGLLSLSITVRRIHDMGFSGWYAFVPGTAILLVNYLAPYIGSILGLITILFLSMKAGSEGMNAYGSVQTAGTWRGVWSRNPIPTGSLENRWVIIAFFILYFIEIALSSNQTYFSVQKLFPTSEISSDMAIKNDLAAIQVEAEKYWGSHGNTYSIAASCNEGMFASDPFELTALASISAKSSTSSASCAANGSAYVVSAPLSTGWWCIDGSGANDSGPIDTPPPAGSYTCRGANASSTTAMTSSMGNQTAATNDRTSYIQSFTQTSSKNCVSAYGPTAAAEGISNNALVSYCSCSSNGVVNRLTDAQISELMQLPENAQSPSFLKDDLISAEEACNSLLKK